MRIKLMTPEEWPIYQSRIVAFAVRYGDRRLTAAALKRLRQLEPSALAPVPAEETPSSAIAVALRDGKLTGFAFAEGAGEKTCIVVTHPDSRGLGIASQLLLRLRSYFGRLSCRVASDNAASMAACFNAGMIAVGLSPGPTGKPTLRFETPDSIPQSHS